MIVKGTANRKNRHEGDTFTDPLSADNHGYLSGIARYGPVMPVDGIARITARNRLVTKQQEVGKYCRLTSGKQERKC